VSSRTQTLVQLTDDLVRRLDDRAARSGTSRSGVIRALLEEALEDDRRAEISRRLVEGYEREPQSEGGDAWGDLSAWTATNTRRNLAALQAEEGG
jgi:predicted transcriptional regulator